MVRNVPTTTTNGLRKNRVTQKTRLHVVRGQLDAEAIVLDDEEERNRVLASQGVDAEDANEHHLQAVLNAANNRKHAGESHGKHHDAHIPTPDAAGVVEGYESLYQSGKYKQPTTHLRFSESVEESVEGGIAGGFAYFLDERDAEWIEKNNQKARGEGTSASGSASTNGQSDDASPASTRSGRMLHSRSTKAKGKEPEQFCSVADHTYPRTVVDEDEFELVMGLFEKLTEDKFPFIHLDLDAFPPLSDYESVFAAPLPPATFANYIVPSSVPPPERLVFIARTVYPYWKERKFEREGKRVVPQLDYDDTQESSYICFRRRDAKPVRRTRASSTAYTDKLARLRSELQMSFDIARLVLEREELKREDVAVAKDVWQARCALVNAWKCEESSREPDMGVDEALLYDRERVLKKPRVEGLGRIVLGLNRRPSGAQSGLGTPNGDSHSPLTAHLELPGINLSTLSPHAYVAVQSVVRERYLGIQAEVEKEMASLRTRDVAWEDLVDMPIQTQPVSYPDKLFRPYLPPASHPSPTAPSNVGIDPAATLLKHETLSSGPAPTHSSGRLTAVPVSSSPPLPSSSDESDSQPLDIPSSFVHSTADRHPRSLRLRTGRGGRLHLDRRLHVRHPHPLHRTERAKWPQDNNSIPDRPKEGHGMTEAVRWRWRDWRPEHESTTKAKAADLVGCEYWAHESIYANHIATIGKRKRVDEDEEVIGFEQSRHGLALSTFAEWEKGPAEDDQWRVEPRSREQVPREDAEEPNERWRVEGRTEDALEHSWRIDERWRHDSDVGRDDEDRFLLDDFQPKFLRTMVTLLDTNDHETVKTDAKHLAPPLIPSSGAKPFPSPGRLTEQERFRLMTLRALRAPQSQSQPQSQSHPQPQLPSIPKLPQHPAPSTTPTPPPPPPQQPVSAAPGVEHVDEQIRRMARQPQPQTPSESPTTPAIPVTPQASQRVITQQSPPTPGSSLTNGFHTRQMSLGNGLSGDDGATVRVSSSMRPKMQTAQQALGPTVNGFANAHANSAFTAHQANNQNHVLMHPGHAHGLNPQQYAALRNVFGVQQQQQQQQPPQQMAMQMQMNGVPGNGNISLQMGPGNLNLKLPPSRPQMRMNGNAGGDVNGVGGSPVPMHTSPPRSNMGGSPIPHARTPSANGHLMTPTHGRASPANPHLLGHASALGHSGLSSSPHHHPNLVALPLHATTTPPRPAPTLMHQQMVGAAGQGHEYS